MLAKKTISILSTVFFTVSSLGLGAAAYAGTAPSLGTANTFAVLAGSQVTNTGATIISGDLGVNPGAMITGFPPGEVINGAIHTADAVSYQAQYDATSAAIELGAQKSDNKLSGKDLGGMTLIPGVYDFTSNAELNGSLTLDAKNDANAVWIFQVGGSFVTNIKASINMINGGKNSNVFFLVGSSVIVGGDSKLIGNIIASSNITMNKGAMIDGKVLALIGAVSLTENKITNAVAVPPVPTPTPEPSPTPTAGAPAIYALDCNFAVVSKKAPTTCSVKGSVCIDGKNNKCVTPEKAIHSNLDISCSDGFTLKDQAAAYAVNGTVLSMQGKDALYNAAAIDFNEFNNKAGTLPSNLQLTYANGTYRSIAGSCVLK